MYGSLLVCPTLMAPLERHTLVQVMHPMQKSWSMHNVLPSLIVFGRISPYLIASVGQALKQYPQRTHLSSSISLCMSSEPVERKWIAPDLHAFTQAPQALQSFVFMFGTFSRIGSDMTLSIWIAS